MSRLHGLGRRKASLPPEGFTLQAFDFDNKEFMHRAMQLNRENTPPRHGEVPPAVEYVRVQEQQREARERYVKGVGLIAVHRKPESIGEPTWPSDVAYGFGGIVEDTQGRLSGRRLEIGNIFGSNTPRGHEAIPLITGRLLLELSQGEQLNIEAADPRRALRLAFSIDQHTHEWVDTRRNGVGSYTTIEPVLPAFWQEQMEKGDAWTMNVRTVLGALATTFPDMPVYTYQDQRR